jgi:hypothetical protein
MATLAGSRLSICNLQNCSNHFLFEPVILLRVFAAFRAAALRFAGPLLFAALFACAETALGDAVRVLSRRNPFMDARALF